MIGFKDGHVSSQTDVEYLKSDAEVTNGTGLFKLQSSCTRPSPSKTGQLDNPRAVLLEFRELIENLMRIKFS